MNYVDLVLGEWYPDGGIRAVPAALEAIAKKYGATVVQRMHPCNKSL